MSNVLSDRTAALETRNGAPPAASEQYVLRLYVTGTTSRSMSAIRNIQSICQKYLDGQYSLEVIDIYQRPEAAIAAQIIAAPTLIKIAPYPVRRAIGDMSNERRVLSALNLSAVEQLGQ